MEQWEREFDSSFLNYADDWNTDAICCPEMIKNFLRKILREERKQDKIQQIMDYIHENKTNTDILIQYIFNNTSVCEKALPSIELLKELGIKPQNKEAIILWILEKYFKEHPKKHKTLL